MNTLRYFLSGHRWLSFLMVATGVFLATMDSSMINVALPSIMRYFSCSFTYCQWVVIVYLLTISISLLFWGHYSDRVGKIKIYLTGMFLFSAGSAGCGFSPLFIVLIFFRFVQATGAAMMMSTGPAIITQAFPGKYLGRTLGMIGVATSAGLMSGPVISGFLLYHYSWRSIFFVTVPLSVIMCLVGRLFVFPTLAKSTIRRRVPFNWKSFCCWALLVILIVLFGSNHQSFNIVRVSWYLTAIIILALLFVYLERTSRQSLLPIKLLKNRYFWTAMVTVTLSFSVLFMVIILIPFYLTFVLQLTTIEIGSVMMTLPVMLSLASPVSGRLYDSIGARKLTTFGLLICTVAVFGLSMLQDESGKVQVMWRLALLGMGQSIFLSPNSASVLSRVTAEFTGVTSGILATCRNLGMLFGVAMAGMVFGFFFYQFSGGADLKSFEPAHISAFVSALHDSFLAASFVSLLGVAISTMR